MGWLDSIRREDRAVTQRGPMTSVQSMFSAGRGLFSTAGKVVTPSQSLTEPTLYACVDRRANAFASMALHLYQRDRKNLAGRTRANRHWLEKLIQRGPNDKLSTWHWLNMMSRQIDLTGNAYCQKVVDDGLRTIAIYPLAPHRMKVWSINGELVYEYTTIEGKTRLFASEEILHLKFATLDGIMGVNPIEYARETIGLALARSEFNAATIANGAAPLGALTLKAKMSEEGADKVRKSWEKLHSGSRNAGRMVILDNEMDYKQIGFSNVDLEWIEQQKLVPAEICKFYAMTEAMLTGDGSEELQIKFMQDAVLPMSSAYESCMEQQLLVLTDKDDYFLEFNLDTIERANLEKRTNANIRNIQWGVRTRNEVRSTENYELLDPEVGDVVLSPLNMVPAQLAVQMALAQIEKSKNAAEQPPMQPEQAANITDPADERSKKVAKRVISDGFSRVFSKEMRKIEQVSKILNESGGFAVFETKLSDFYGEQRATFAEMILPGILTALELKQDVTPAVEIRAKQLSYAAADTYINNSIAELRSCVATDGNIVRTFLEWEAKRPALEADSVVVALFNGE